MFKFLFAKSLLAVGLFLMPISQNVQAQSQKSDWQLPIQNITSPKGLPFILVQDQTLPIISLEFAFVGGASTDPEDKKGLTTFLASMLKQGAGTLDANAFENELLGNGIEMSFSTSRDTLRGSMRTIASKSESAVKLLSLALQSPTFAQKDMDRVRANQLSKIKAIAQDPEQEANVLLFEKAFTNTSYGFPSLGVAQHVEKFTKVDLTTHAQKLLTTSALHIVIVGQLNEQTASEMVDKIFSQLPKGQKSEYPSLAMQNLGQTFTKDNQNPQSVIRFMLPALPFNDPDFMALSVANHILGGGTFSSRLYKQVREERGLTYSVHSSLFPLKQAPMWFTSVATRPEKVQETIDLITQNMREMGEKGPTDEEMSEAKSYLIGSWPLRFDSSSKIASEILDFEFNGAGKDYITQRNAKLATLTKEQVAQAARKIFATQKPIMIVIGPQGNK